MFRKFSVDFSFRVGAELRTIDSSRRLQYDGSEKNAMIDLPRARSGREEHLLR